MEAHFPSTRFCRRPGERSAYRDSAGQIGNIVSRRRFLKSAGAAAAFSVSPLRGFSSPAVSAIPSPCFLQAGSGYTPFVKRSVQHIQPGADGFLAEKYAAGLTSELISWQHSFLASTRDLHEVPDLVSETVDASLLNHGQVTPLRSEPPVHSDELLLAPAERVSRRAREVSDNCSRGSATAAVRI